MTWIDVVDPTVEELEVLADQYGLAQRTFDEAHRRAARPTMHRFDDHVYMVAFSGSLAEIDMYLGPTWFITVRRHDADGREWDPQPILDRFERRDATTKTSGQLFATLLEELIDGYFDTTDVLEEKLEVIEDNIFSDGAAHRATPATRPVRSFAASCWSCGVPSCRCARCCRRSCVSEVAVDRRRGPGHRATTRSTSCCAPSIWSTSSANSSATPSMPTSR